MVVKFPIKKQTFEIKIWQKMRKKKRFVYLWGYFMTISVPVRIKEYEWFW